MFENGIYSCQMSSKFILTSHDYAFEVMKQSCLILQK